MKVFLPIDTEQNLVIVAREESTNVVLTIKNKQEETETTINATTTSSNGYMTIPVTYTFKEGHQYGLKVTDGTDVIWRGQGYATDQTDLQEFKLNIDEIIIA